MKHNVYGPFSLKKDQNPNENISEPDKATTACCQVMIMSCGKLLPQVTKCVKQKEHHFDFLIDSSYNGEMVEISLLEMMPQHKKPTEDALIGSMRKKNDFKCKTNRRSIDFRHYEHHVCMICINGDESVIIESEFHKQQANVLLDVNFIMQNVTPLSGKHQ